MSALHRMAGVGPDLWRPSSPDAPESLQSKASKLRQRSGLGNQESVNLCLIFPTLFQFVNSFSRFDFLAWQEKRIFGSLTVLMQENSFQLTLE